MQVICAIESSNGRVSLRLIYMIFVAPQQAYANIQALRTLYPGVYRADGFFDAVNPATGAVGHDDLVLDQSMIMGTE